MSGALLFVGSRVGAVRAAGRIGASVRMLRDRRPLSDAVVPYVTTERQVDFSDRAAIARAARELGADGAVRAVLGLTEGTVLPAAWAREALGLPGMSVVVAERCSDKIAMKRAAAAGGLPCTAWREVGPATDPAQLMRELGLPLVLKRARSSGSRGLLVTQDPAAARAAFAGRSLAERFIRGREMSVESFVSLGRPVFTNPTEYLVPLHANLVPAELAPAEVRTVLELNHRAITAMGIERGMTHLELYLTDSGPLFGEIAARPPGGRIMRLLERVYGFSPWETLIAIELGESIVTRSRPRGGAGTWILHPGPGVVDAVCGLEEARAVPGVHRVVCRVGPGDRIAPREGSGQDVGFIDARGTDRATVVTALRTAHAALRFRMRAADAG